jgi:uncharacterized BrkB/YihY/UPF0761 family membrane protein
MFAIIFSIILIIVGIIAGVLIGKFKVDEGDDETFKFRTWPVLVAIVVSAMIFIASCLAIVPTGFTGILTTFGRVEERTIPAGLNFIAPWQNVKTMDNRTQKVEIQTSAFSR